MKRIRHFLAGWFWSGSMGMQTIAQSLDSNCTNRTIMEHAMNVMEVVEKYTPEKVVGHMVMSMEELNSLTPEELMDRINAIKPETNTDASW